jgi:hypothetical protein
MVLILQFYVLDIIFLIASTILTGIQGAPTQFMINCEYSADLAYSCTVYYTYINYISFQYFAYVCTSGKIRASSEEENIRRQRRRIDFHYAL